MSDQCDPRPTGYGDPKPLVCEHGRQRSKCEVCQRDEELAELRTRLAEVESDRDELRRALGKYGRHLRPCADRIGDCECGFDAAGEGKDAAERDWERRYMSTEPQDEGG